MTYPYNDPNICLLTDLLHIPAPSGREELMGKEIMRRIADLGHAPQQDQQGNVWVEIPGQNPKLGRVALACHMDELAMVITAINADGTLQVRPSGGLHPWKLGECPVEILTDGAKTVAAHLSFGSTHTVDPSDPNTQLQPGKAASPGPTVTCSLASHPNNSVVLACAFGSTAVPHLACAAPTFSGRPTTRSFRRGYSTTEAAASPCCACYSASQRKKQNPIAPLACVFSCRRNRIDRRAGLGRAQSCRNFCRGSIHAPCRAINASNSTLALRFGQWTARPILTRA